MSNSPLVNYTRISPNQYKPRNHKIDTITIHCMAGQLTAETCGAIFASPNRQASSNYSVGSDLKYGLYVDENCGSWCSSSYSNDMRAITIEVASDSFYPYKVTDEVYNALIKLVVDICKRNGIKKLVWSNSRDDRINHRNGCNMTVHRDFSNTACPGDYLYDKMGDIAKKVNAKLSPAKIKPGDILKARTDAKLYNHSYKDPVGHNSKSYPITKGTKVKLIKDLENGWSQVEYKNKKYWTLNGYFSSNLSTFKVVTLKRTRLCRKVKNGKLAKTPTSLKKGTEVTDICNIKLGKYKGYAYIGIGKNRYYIKNLKG